jgi:hypothetical protein
MNVYQCINRVQASLNKTGISKNRIAQQGASFKFRGIDDVYNAISPLLAEAGMCILPRMISRHCDERQSTAGKALFYVTVEAEFDLVSAEDGTRHTIRTFGEAMDSGDKATNKAMSAAYKYACFQAFAIPTEGDNDPDAHVHEVIRTMPEEDVEAHQIAMHKAQSTDVLRIAFGSAYTAAKAIGDSAALTTLTNFYAIRKQTLAEAEQAA